MIARTSNTEEASVNYFLTRRRRTATSSLRGRDCGPRPARTSTALAVVRGGHRRFQRRLPRDYAHFGDGHPGRHQSGRGCWAGRSRDTPTTLPSSTAAPPTRPRGDATTPVSVRGATLRTRSYTRSLLCSPSLDLGPQPELYTTGSKVEHGLRHVGVAPLVLGDGIPVGKAEDFGNALCVDQVLGGDLWAHGAELTSLGGSVRPAR